MQVVRVNDVSRLIRDDTLDRGVAPGGRIGEREQAGTYNGLRLRTLISGRNLAVQAKSIVSPERVIGESRILIGDVENWVCNGSRAIRIVGDAINLGCCQRAGEYEGVGFIGINLSGGGTHVAEIPTAL